LDAVVRPGAELDYDRDDDRYMTFVKSLVSGNEPLQKLLYAGRLIAFYEALLGGAVRHFDFTWMRVVPPGGGTWVHTDIVFMGRGTTNLFTSWVPYGDVPFELGGLAILEGSHLKKEIRDVYGRLDVDVYCENFGEAPQDGFGHFDGELTNDAATFREGVGGRWLTTEFCAGDLVIFGMYLAHGGLDNQTDRFRLSSDSRYQRASEPVDERWIGVEPPGHARSVKKGVIC